MLEREVKGPSIPAGSEEKVHFQAADRIVGIPEARLLTVFGWQQGRRHNCARARSSYQTALFSGLLGQKYLDPFTGSKICLRGPSP